MEETQMGLTRARSYARSAVERLYEDRCSVRVDNDKHYDAGTNLTSLLPRTIITDEPCRLSYKSLTSTTPDNSSAVVMQSTVLYIAPEIVIPPGSVITVTKKNGTKADYHQSGFPAMYSTHQEIPIILKGGRA